MQADIWKKIEALYHDALSQPPEDRAAFLERASPDDPLVRREVHSLLTQKTDSLFECALLAAPPELRPGDKLGNFEIVELLGRGGMGEVWRARDLRLQRDVAIKVVWEAFNQRFESEAHSIAALTHPHICALYDVGPNYLVMEYIEGETLAARIRRGPIPLGEALKVAIEIADALAAAHSKGIVHRDLKPANIMLTGAGAKLLDFGLARRQGPLTDDGEAVTALAGQAQVVGTLPYMSPEQLRGFRVDQRTDVFSFGVMLYEMVDGNPPFTGRSTSDVCEAILHARHRDLGNSVAPGKLKAIIRKLLEKDPANRYGSAGDVHQEMKALAASLEPVAPVRLSKKAWIAVAAAVALAGILTGWVWHGSSRRQWALETAAPEIAQLIDLGEYVKAAALTREARSVLPKDPTLEKLWTRTTGEVSVASVPSEADVSIRPYQGAPNAWEFIGKTPLKRVRLPIGDYVFRISKAGYVASLGIVEPPGVPIPGADFTVDLKRKLRHEGSVPPGMVVVAGDTIGLEYPLGQAPEVQIDDCLIDRHEVTNEEYKKFVEAAGYQKREFWKQPFVRDGHSVSWDDAVALFRDATGRPGPSTWDMGDYPKGHERYPVAGVSWYEAAAYAEFVGKSLPTAYHWTRASQAGGHAALIASGSNFARGGTQPVGAESALSGFGTTDMAGNVKEWCLNEARDGKRLILGGGFGEPNYMFYHTDAQSPWDRRGNFGFRCVKLESPPSAAAAAHIEVTTRDYWKDKPVSNEVFKAYTALYAYDKMGLNAHVEEIASLEGCSRAKVTFDAAYGHERVTAYLFLPTDASPPFQAVVYFPGAGSFTDDKLDLSRVEETRGFLVKSGRALIVPIYKGMYERRDGLMPGSDSPPAFRRDHEIAWSKDLGRSLDYLETRKDIDGTKIAYFGDSLGGTEGAHLTAVEKRIKVAILSSGGFQLTMRYLPEADPFNFAPRVTIPVLMLNGRYDGTFPVESSQRPLFHFLGTPIKDKKYVIYEGGHVVFPVPDAVRQSLDWLDKYLGPVRRKDLPGNK